MKGLVILMVLIGVWAAVATLLRRKGWTAIKRHVGAGLCGFFAMLLVTGAIMDPPDRKPPVPAPAAASSKASEIETPAADTADTAEAAGADGKSTDTKIQKLADDIVAVDHMDHATPPKLVITLKKSGWDEKQTFYAFVGDASQIVAKATDKKLTANGVDFVFILRVAVSSVDGDGAKKTSDQNILQILVPAADVPAILADKDRPAESALLRRAQVEFNGRIGRDMVTDFCTAELYQGRSGVSPSKTFCQSALQ
jgi:hypothetical protein